MLRILRIHERLQLKPSKRHLFLYLIKSDDSDPNFLGYFFIFVGQTKLKIRI